MPGVKQAVAFAIVGAVRTKNQLERNPIRETKAIKDLDDIVETLLIVANIFDMPS